MKQMKLNYLLVIISITFFSCDKDDSSNNEDKLLVTLKVEKNLEQIRIDIDEEKGYTYKDWNIDLNTSVDQLYTKLNGSKFKAKVTNEIDYYTIKLYGEKDELTFIDIVSNEIISLDVSGCTSLYYLCCENESSTPNHSQLRSLDVSNCASLQHLKVVYADKLTSLEVLGCNKLEKIFLYHTGIRVLTITTKTPPNIYFGGAMVMIESIRVPANLVNIYINSSAWQEYAGKIRAI